MKLLKNKVRYDGEFYKRQAEGSKKSAFVMLETLFALYKPRSVLDIGCGVGAWLSAAEALGVEKLYGYEGDWVKKEMLLSNRIELTSMDLSEAFVSQQKADLAMSLEVGEHLPKANSTVLVSALCSASDVVLFGAGIPYQWGTSHINLQWQSFWVDLFKKHNFTAYDVIRTVVWRNDSVEWWYRQNALLYVKDGSQSIDPAFLIGRECRMPDVVLPEYYECNMKAFLEPTLKSCFGSFKRYIKKLKNRC